MVPADSLLVNWLTARADESALQWLTSKTSEIVKGGGDLVFFTTYSAASRHFSKDDLDLNSEETQEAEEMRSGWRPANWTMLQSARTVVLLSAPVENQERFIKRIERLAGAADIGESVALYQALPLLPHPERLIPQAVEGLRTNMTSVFNAITAHNPYPAEYFSKDQWNQMVLKAVFVGTSLHRIQGLDERANPTLARMLVDYAHERWAAGRDVTPELWRPVGPHATSDYVLDALEKALRDGPKEAHRAAALALSSSPSDRAKNLLDDHPALTKKINSGELSWPDERSFLHAAEAA